MSNLRNKVFLNLITKQIRFIYYNFQSVQYIMYVLYLPQTELTW